MSRLWTERREIGTIIIGTTPDTDRQVRQAASHSNYTARHVLPASYASG